jgi:hypothetical protein
VLSPMAFEPAPFEIPDDGLEHECPCGEHLYRVADHLAWGPHPTDIEGRWVGSCSGCGRDLSASKPLQPQPEEN